MTVTVVLLAALFILPALWYFYTLKFTRFQRMVAALPSPSGVPLLGHAFILPTDAHEFYKKIHIVCAEFTKTGIFSLDFGFLRKLIVVTSADVAEKLLRSTKNITKSDVYDHAVPWLGTGLLIAGGAKWRTRRRLLTPSFHFKILQEFLITMNEQAVVMNDCLKKNVGKGSFDMFPYITHCALDIICLTAMGKGVNAQEDGETEYVEAVYKASELVHVRQFRPWLWPHFIYDNIPAGKEWKRCLGILHGFTNSVIAERMEEHKRTKLIEAETSVDDDDIGTRKRYAFLDTLLEQADENALSLEDIREEVDTFMFEGHDTTAAGIAWSTHLLGEYPEIQAKVHEELDEIFGDSDRDIEFEDLPNLKYLECVIKEAQRMFPSVPMIGRELEEDTELGGFNCPKGAQVAIMITELHANPDIFPEPEKFNPDRFLLENAAGRHPYSYVPFSAGPRNCIGQKFAMMEEKVMIASTLRKYNIESTQRTDELEPCSELILRPGKGVHVKLTPRITE